EAVGGLVQDQQLGILQQRGRDAETLLHAGRVGAELPSCSRGKLDDVEDFLHALVVDAREVGDHPHVFPATQVRVEAGGLDEGADLGQSGGVAGGVAG